MVLDPSDMPGQIFGTKKGGTFVGVLVQAGKLRIASSRVVGPFKIQAMQRTYTNQGPTNLVFNISSLDNTVFTRDMLMNISDCLFE